jgi:hypothetical protein
LCVFSIFQHFGRFHVVQHVLLPCKYPFPLNFFHFWIFNNLFLFYFFYIGGHFENV